MDENLKVNRICSLSLVICALNVSTKHTQGLSLNDKLMASLITKYGGTTLLIWGCLPDVNCLECHFELLHLASERPSKSSPCCVQSSALPGAPGVLSTACHTPWRGPPSVSSLHLPLTGTSSDLERKTMTHENKESPPPMSLFTETDKL